jgi:hypothetical protein
MLCPNRDQQTSPAEVPVRQVFASRPLLLVFFLVLASIFVYTAGAHAFKVTLTWDPNASNEGIAGYKIYYGTESQNYTAVIDVSDATIKSVATLKKGMLYYFAATAYNSSGVESSFSEEVTVNTCAYQITPKKKTFKATGGENKVRVRTQSNCEWTAESGNDALLTINDGRSGKGKGYIIYTVNPNPDPEARTVDSTFAGKSFKVTQKGTGISN